MAHLTTRKAILEGDYGFELTRSVRGLPEGATVLVAQVEGVPTDKTFTHPKGNRGWTVGSGWNGSYHDAWYNPYLVAWAKGPAALRRARRMLREAKATMTTVFADTAVARFQAHTLVRPGD